MRLAPCLVRVNTSARCMRGRRSSAVEQRALVGPRRRRARAGRPARPWSTDGRRPRRGSGSRRRPAARSLDRRRHRRREEQRLALRRQRRDDLAHVVDEAHVEHAVGLVEHEALRRRRARRGPARIRSSRRPGRRDQDVDAARERLHLRLLADAAEDDGAAQAEVAAVGREALADLRARARASASAPARAAVRGPARGASPRGAGGSAARTPRSCRCRSGRSRAGRGRQDVGIACAWIGVGRRSPPRRRRGAGAGSAPARKTWSLDHFFHWRRRRSSLQCEAWARREVARRRSAGRRDEVDAVGCRRRVWKRLRCGRALSGSGDASGFARSSCRRSARPCAGKSSRPSLRS